MPLSSSLQQLHLHTATNTPVTTIQPLHLPPAHDLPSSTLQSGRATYETHQICPCAHIFRSGNSVAGFSCLRGIPSHQQPLLLRHGLDERLPSILAAAARSSGRRAAGGGAARKPGGLADMVRAVMMRPHPQQHLPQLASPLQQPLNQKPAGDVPSVAALGAAREASGHSDSVAAGPDGGAAATPGAGTATGLQAPLRMPTPQQRHRHRREESPPGTGSRQRLADAAGAGDVGGGDDATHTTHRLPSAARLRRASGARCSGLLGFLRVCLMLGGEGFQGSPLLIYTTSQVQGSWQVLSWHPIAATIRSRSIPTASS